MTNGEKFDQTFGIGQANLAIATCSWWDEEYKEPCHNCGAKLNVPEDIEQSPDGYCEDAEIEIAHVGYTAEQCGYDK